MTKGIQIVLSLAIVLVLAAIGWSWYHYRSADTITIPAAETANATPTATSSEELETRYFGNRVDADFNGDGATDAAFIVTQTGSGSGTFYYLAHTLGGEAAFLGDRIAPQSTEWKNGKVIVNYADRKPGEPMTTKPSVGITKYFKAEVNTLVEVKAAAAPTQNAAGGSTSLTTGEKCAAQGGTWSAQYKECTGIGETSCKAIGGTFNECASPCRNDPDAQVCILMCVQVCAFK